MLLIGTLAGIATVLAVVGVYGVMSYAVARRTHEIGIRMALGADASDVLRLIVGQGMTLALAGVALGLLGAFALLRVMAKMLYGTSSYDPLTFVAISLLLVSVSLLACYLPARRAAKLDPMLALGHG